MSRPIIFGMAARSEVIEAARWYEDHGTGLGVAFTAEVDAAVIRIAENPLHYPLVHKTLRRIRLRRFPYGLYYVVESELIRVLACFHSNRHPRGWLERN